MSELFWNLEKGQKTDKTRKKTEKEFKKKIVKGKEFKHILDNRMK